MLRLPALAALCAFAATVTAQNFYLPDNVASAGNCNVIPLGGSSSGAFTNQKYQQLVLASDLGGVPNLITGLGFAPCRTGVNHFDTIKVVLDHTTATTLSTTFAANLTANAVTVLDAVDYDWNTPTAHTWQELGLQDFFVYNGTDNVVVEITTTGSSCATSHHVGNRQRVYSISWSGTPPATGSTDNAALKLEVGMLMARLSSHGRGCRGSNQQVPAHTVTGVPQLGQPLAFDVANALPTSVVFLGLGFGAHRAPFPIDLGVVGMPGCLTYFSPAGLVAFVTDNAGVASLPLAVPNNSGMLGMRMYSQWICLDPNANPGGAATSNYIRIQVGN